MQRMITTINPTIWLLTALLGNVIYCLINLSDCFFDAEATFKTFLGIQMF